MLVENALFATLDPTTRRGELARRPAQFTSDRHRRVRPAPAAPSWSRRSARRWRRSSTPTCWCTSSTAPTTRRRSQIAAVREVLDEIGAGHVRELIVINKADVADPETVAAPAAPRAARGRRVGAHRPGLRRAAARDRARAAARPVEVDLLVPYDRGDLVAARTGRARSWARSTRRPAPCCAPACPRPSPTNWPQQSMAEPPDASSLTAGLAAVVSAIGGEDREGQLLMAQTVAASLSGSGHAVVQAGTGTGKSAGLPGAGRAPRGLAGRRAGHRGDGHPRPAAPARRPRPAARGRRPGLGRRPADRLRGPEGPQQLRVPAEAARQRARGRGGGALRHPAQRPGPAGARRP